MPEKIAERLLWAVDIIATAPDDHVLEIGCGTGTAAALLCERLTGGGKLTALDRSQTMIAQAREKNAAHIAARRADFIAAPLAEADFGSARFNKIFAVNVNVFWQQPARELAVIRAWLAPEGTLYLFYQPPAREKAQEIVEKVTAHLDEGGFTVREVLTKELDTARVVCVAAGIEARS